jgi:hypothetical protein
VAKQTTVVVQEPDGPVVAAEVIATALIEISTATKAMLRAGLKYETIVTLIHANSGVSKTNVRLVLNNLESMKETWCSK